MAALAACLDLEPVRGNALAYDIDTLSSDADLAGNPLSLSARSGSARVLSAQEVAAGSSSRAQIFAAFGGGAGWNPQP